MRFPRHNQGKFPLSGFFHLPVCAEQLNLLRGQAGDNFTRHHPQCRRNGSVTPHDPLHREGGLDILRVRHSVGDDR